MEAAILVSCLRDAAQLSPTQLMTYLIYLTAQCQYHRWLLLHDTTLPLKNVNCFAAPLQFIVCSAQREGDWGEGITMQLHEFILPCRVSRLALCLAPSPHSPCRVLLDRRSTDSSDSYHVDGAVY